ncbi:MAG: ECF-type sigma factor [Planctomycetota bacterium]|jgi:RNA polymerase sigma factor (TIGR02999 family)
MGTPNRSEDSAGTGRQPTDPLSTLVYDELRDLARRHLREERRDHTLQPTALVNEAWMRMGEHCAVDREHFLALAARTMRRVLIDHARRQRADKRGGRDWRRVTLAEPVTPHGGRELDVLEIHELLERLSVRDPRGAQVVELRYFGGLSIDETARVLDVSRSTVDADWFAAKAWLARELLESDGR